jgi:hypothetical protein
MAPKTIVVSRGIAHFNGRALMCCYGRRPRILAGYQSISSTPEQTLWFFLELI